MKNTLCQFVCVFFFVTISANVAPAEIARFSPFDDLDRVPADVTELQSANVDAPKGGALRLGSIGNFDSTNLMSFPGNSPAEMVFIFDSLLVQGSQPATFYGKLAEEIEVASDFSQVRFVLDAEARWHDGTPITAHDVAFTFETLALHGLPIYRSLLDGMQISVLDDRTIVLRPEVAGGWQWIPQLGGFPIQSRAFWTARDPSQKTLDQPLGSGPYRIKDIQFNRLFSLERVDNYWAVTHPLSRGRWNFDQIRVDYFYDATAMREALKRGDLDWMREFDPAAWRDGYNSPSLRDGRIVKTAINRADGGALKTLVMNLRRPPLNDVRVREALGLAFDVYFYHELHGGLYDIPMSFYGSTRLAAKGEASSLERRLLDPFSEILPIEILDAPRQSPGVLSDRQRLLKANRLLDDAGFSIVQGKRIDPVTGEQLTLTFVTHSSLAQRFDPYRKMLSQLGINLDILVGDYVTIRKQILGHEFDLTFLSWSPSDPPGGLERLYWHSSQANSSGYGLAGLENPAADALIATMRSSLDEDEVVAAARAFDRFLQWGHYTIPMWRETEYWIVHAAGLGFPSLRGALPSPASSWFWREPRE